MRPYRVFLALKAICLLCVYALPVCFAATIQISYVYDSLGRLIAVIDPAADTAIYNYDAVGNVLSIDRRSSSVPSVIEFTPKSGPVGTSVTIHGTTFSAVPAQNTVKFNNIVATITSASPTTLIATVPAGATTGLIDVTTPAGSASSSAPFTVTGSIGAPTIISFTPAVGTAGTAVAITGTNFDTSASNNIVRINGAITNVTSSTSTTINAPVPAGTGSGRISVLTSRGSATSSADFFVPPAPYTAADVGFTSRLTVGGGGVTVTISSGGKIGLVTLDGNAGQWVRVQMTNVTYTNNFANVHLRAPNVSTVYSSTAVPQTGGEFTVQLPDTGTYTLAVNAIGSLTTGGMMLTVTNTTPGTNPLSLSCNNGSCSLSCAPGSSVGFTATGGKAPYSWSTTKGIITPAASHQSQATLTPPANPGSGVGGFAYAQGGINKLCQNLAHICKDGGLTQNCGATFGAGIFGCNNQVIYPWVGLDWACGPKFGVTPTSQICFTSGGASYARQNTCVMNVTNCYGKNYNQHCVGTGGLYFTEMADLRSQAMKDAGCKPCRAEMTGAMVTVTDANGAKSSKPIVVNTAP